MNKQIRICLDLDGTICESKSVIESYDGVCPLPGAVETMHEWKRRGYYIIIQTARHMHTHKSNEGAVLATGGPILFDWLKKWDIPYDEIYFGKPHADILIDDAAYTHTSWSESARKIDDIERHYLASPSVLYRESIHGTKFNY